MRPSSLLLTSLAALLCVSPALSQSSPVCSAAPEADLIGKHFPAYLTDSESELKSEVSALHGIKFSKPTPGEVDPILAQTGAAIAALLPRIPRLVANEQLTQTAVALPYLASETTQDSSSGGGRTRYTVPSVSTDSHPVEGEDLQKAITHLLTSQSQHSTFSYRIQSRSDPALGTVVEEFRTDSSNSAVVLNDRKPGSPNGVGFSNSWLLFMPASQLESSFRLLGHEKIDNRDTVVVAFAQTPGKVHLPAEIGVKDTTCSYFTQGILWIDPTTFEIVRLQTDLLHPISGIHLAQLRSEIRFSEVKIPERNLTLSMPSDLEISWKTTTQAGGELHRYSDYRLFTATSKLLMNPVN